MGSPRKLVALLIAMLALAVSATAAGSPATPTPSGASAEEPEESESTATPRRAVGSFLGLARQGRFQEASQLLDLRPEQRASGAMLARRLRLVLDERIWVDLKQLSSSPQGVLDDGLSPGVDEVGVITRASGARDPLRLVLRKDAPGPRWVFAHTTVDRINDWFAELPDAWLVDRLPAFALTSGPKEILLWQWFALLLVGAASAFLAIPFARLTRRVLQAITANHRVPWDYVSLETFQGPLRLGWALVFGYLTMPRLGLYEPARDFVHRILHATVLVLLFWIGFRLIDIGHNRVARVSMADRGDTSQTLLGLTSRVAKMALFGLGLAAVLADLGYPVMSILAGLGIGGLALALAAQKTFENLFGALALGLDKPFRVGDYIRIGELEGTVEAVGLRSTKLRTPARSRVTIPNGQLAEQRIDCLSARDYMQVSFSLGVSPDSPTDALEKMVNDLRATLQKRSEAHPDPVTVTLSGMEGPTLRLDVRVWIKLVDAPTLEKLRTEFLLLAKRVSESHGVAMSPLVPKAAPLVGGAPIRA